VIFVLIVDEAFDRSYLIFFVFDSLL